MYEKKHIPISLKIVAILFILGGIHSVIEVVLDALNSKVNINFGILGLFIGFGLLALRPGWRKCALVFIWIALIAVPILTIFMFMHSGPLDFNIFGQKVGYATKEFGLVVAISIFLLELWQYHVLNRSDIRMLFGVG